MPSGKKKANNILDTLRTSTQEIYLKPEQKKLIRELLELTSRGVRFLEHLNEIVDDNGYIDQSHSLFWPFIGSL